MQTKNLAFIHRIVVKNNFWDIDIKNIKPPSPPPPPCYRQWGGFPQCKCWKCDWSKLSDSVCEIGQSELFLKKKPQTVDILTRGSIPQVYVLEM